MEMQDLSKSEFSKKLGLSEEKTQKLLNGPYKMSIQTMTEMAFVLGYSLKVEFIPLETKITTKPILSKDTHETP